MFRIIFDPKTARFVVQILQWAVWWRTCHEASFDTYAEARHWVNSIGLNSLCVELEMKKVYSAL